MPVSGIYSYSLNASLDRYYGLGGDITIPEYIDETYISIIDSAFSDMNLTITSITIDYNICRICDNALRGFRKLSAFYVNNNPFYSSYNGILYDKYQTTLLRCPPLVNASMTLPEDLQIIERRAFEYCSTISNIIITNSVKFIGNGAFRFSSLTSCTLPNKLAAIGENLFYGCTNLTTVTLPNSLTSIGQYAFSLCPSLKSFDIPSSVERIDNGAFYQCSNLASAYFFGDAPLYIGNDVFRECSPNFKVYFYAGKTGYTPNLKGYPTIPFYTVTYNGNGNTSGELPQDDNRYLEGDTVKALDKPASLIKQGYFFKSWNTKADGSGKNYSPESTFPVGIEHITLYAKWSLTPTRGVNFFQK